MIKVLIMMKMRLKQLKKSSEYLAEISLKQAILSIKQPVLDEKDDNYDKLQL